MPSRLTVVQEELTKARERIEELEEANSAMLKTEESHVSELQQLKKDEEERSKELSSMRNRFNLSSQNWSKERDDLTKREVYIKEELEMAKQAMQDWEVLAMEERSIRENLAEKAAEFEEQVITLRESNQALEADRNTQNLNIDGLQRALRELQEGLFC